MSNGEDLLFDALLGSIKPPEGRFYIDEFTNAVDYLKKSEFFLSQYNDSFRWKWVTIALLSGLYHFMICALAPDNYARVIDHRQMKKKDKDRLQELSLLTSPEADIERRKICDEFLHSSKAKLISFYEALKRVQKPEYMTFYVHSRPVILSKQESENIMELCSVFRNRFVHYKPLAWSISEALFPPLFRDTSKAIQSILESGNLCVYRGSLEETGESFADVKDCVARIKDSIEENDNRLKGL